MTDNLRTTEEQRRAMRTRASQEGTAIGGYHVLRLLDDFDTLQRRLAVHDLRRQEQTDVVHGNCWQTAVACVLGIPLEELPDQVEIEKREDGSRGSYSNMLNWYLIKHHRLMYSEFYDYQFGAVQVREPGFHMLVGPTVRTESNGMHHVTVGRYGKPFWDPHPSKAGLLFVEKWGILGPVANWLVESWKKHEYTCVCAACSSSRTV